MIDKLTPAQEAKIPEYCQKGIDVGISTEPADWDKADTAINELYEFCELEKPKNIYHVSSTIEAQKKINELNGNEEKTYTDTHGYGHGQYESYWIYTYKYYEEVIKLEIEEKALRGLNIMKDLADSSGYHYLFDDFAIIVDRLEEVHFNDANELHNDDGAAILMRCGTKIYCLDGHEVPELIVMNPELITPDMIKKEGNAEVSRIMIEKYGLERYLMDVGGKVIDMDTGLNKQGSAMRSLIQDDQGHKWLIGSDGSTKRTYNMSVPDDCTTCAEAHKQISGLDDEARIISES